MYDRPVLTYGGNLMTTLFLAMSLALAFPTGPTVPCGSPGPVPAADLTYSLVGTMGTGSGVLKYDGSIHWRSLPDANGRVYVACCAGIVTGDPSTAGVFAAGWMEAGDFGAVPANGGCVTLVPNASTTYTASPFSITYSLGNGTALTISGP